MGRGKSTSEKGPRLRRGSSASKSLAAVFIAAQFTSGCAEFEPEWAPLMYLQAEIADGLASTYCGVKRLFGSGLASSEFAERADPELLEKARRDAERACLRSLEVKTEERARRLPGRNNL